MKAVQFHEHGGRDVLVYEDVPTPETHDVSLCGCVPRMYVAARRV